MATQDDGKTSPFMDDPVSEEVRKKRTLHQLKKKHLNLTEQQWSHLNITSSSLQAWLIPSLAYIHLKISTEKDKNCLPLKVLHDSVCTVTTMRSRALLRIPGSNVNLIDQPNQPILTQSCTGEMSPSKGTANIWLHFEGENGNVILTQQKVVVSDHIDYDLILGHDVTGFLLKIAETNDHIYLMQARQTRIFNLLEFLQSH